MDERIELADGTVVQNAYVVSLTDTRIAIYAKGEHTFDEMAKLFGTKNRTKIMKSYQYQDVLTWVGFTNVTAVQINEGNACVCLEKQ